MIFHVIIIDNKAVHKQVDYKLPIDANIQGLQFECMRPQSVTLTRKELLQVSLDKSLACNILTALGDTE